MLANSFHAFDLATNKPTGLVFPGKVNRQGANNSATSPVLFRHPKALRAALVWTSYRPNVLLIQTVLGPVVFGGLRQR